MSIPVFPDAAQSSDPGAKIRDLAAQGKKALKQGEASGKETSVNSFLQFLQGAVEDSKGADEPEQGEQAQATASLQLMALLFQLDPAQLANFARNASQASGSEGGTAQSEEGGRLLSLLQEMASGNTGQEKFLRALASGNLFSGSEGMGELSEILQGMQGEKGKSGLTEQQTERLLRLFEQGKEYNSSESGKSRNADTQPDSWSKLVSALRGISSEGRLSGEQVDRILKDLQSVTSQTSGETPGRHAQEKNATEARQLGRLAAVLQQAGRGDGQSGPANASTPQGNAGNGQPEVNLARLFLESFGRGEPSGQEKSSGQQKGADSSSAKGSSNLRNQDSSIVRSLIQQEGQARSKGPEISTAQSSARSEGANPGVSTKPGDWGSLFSSFRGAVNGSLSGAVSRASQPSGPSSMMDNQVLQQVVSKLQTDLQRGSSRINVRMYPPELGKVQMKLVSEDSNMQVQLQVQNSQVQSILERNMPALRQALEQQDLDFDSIQVSVESGQDNGSGEYSRENEPDFASRPGGNAFFEPEDEGEDARGYVDETAGSSGISLRV